MADNASTTELTVTELREWLRNWVANATTQPVDKISVDRPLEEFGLASRDAIALAGDVEELTGVMLTATVVYEHPTIASLAQRIIEGEPDVPEGANDDSYYTDVEHGPEHDIAIVGLSTRLPQAGETPDSTWEFLAAGGDGISDLPPGRWAEFTADPAVADAVAKAHTRGGYLVDEDTWKGFDAEFFAMSPVEVERVDPQQRLMMELAWEALEHARIPASDLKGTHVGVFIGSSTNDFQLVSSLGLSKVDPNAPQSAAAYALTGGSSSIIANRVSYFYDFRGPSVAIDTACSSTVVAVHQAVQALRKGEASLALAGGVNLLLAPVITLGFDSVGAVAPDGHIKAFSSDADGMVRSEGAGLVVLKRLVDAERDGDQVLAVIKGTAVNSDGRSNGLLAPNPEAQADVLRQAYRDAGIVPSTIDYIDAHGTGTILGDPIEADALGRVVGRGRDDDKPALLGSAKTNFGHLESAAGVASLAKVIMAMQRDVLPPSLNYAGPNPYIPFDKAHLKVITETTAWPRYSGRAVAGISGFGFGGTNAHMVVQEYVKPEAAAAEPPVSDLPELPVVLAVSAYLPSRRKRAAAELAQWLESGAGKDVPLADVGRSLAKRNHGRSRAVVLATTHTEAITGLRAIAAGKAHPTVFSADAPAAKGAIWVLSGFGSQHRKMAKQLYAENPVFAKAVDEVDELVVYEAGYSVKEMFLDDAQDYDVGTSQVGIFTIQVGLAAVLRHHGANPAGVVGHSLGEVAGAYITGGLALEDAVRVICARSRLMGEGEANLTGDDIRLMGVVEYSVDEISSVLTDYPDLEIAVYASPQHTVVGGPEDQVNALVARAEAEGKTGRLLATKGAGHTSMMDALLGELYADIAGLEPGKLTAAVFSTVGGDEVYPTGHAPIHNEDYWTRNMRQAVHFAGAVRKAVEAGHTTFIELSPNPVALVPVAATAFTCGVHDARLIQTLKRKEDESAGLVSALAQLYVAGHAVNLPSLFAPGAYADIPRTAFVRRQYWPDVRISMSGQAAATPGTVLDVPEGVSVQIQSGPDGKVRLVFTGEVPAQQAPVVDKTVESVIPAEIVETVGGKWDPNGSISAEDRLAEIVAESMGYATEDLPREIPLIELGLDSLMAMRIKNRVEYEFDIPQLQLQAMRDANLMDVAKYLRYAIDHREEVQALYDQQQAEKAAQDSQEQVKASSAPAAPTSPPSEKTEPDVPPRDAAERLTFATWAVVVGKSAGGIFTPLPELELSVAAKLADRLTERATGEITVDDVRAARTIEQLSDSVRQHLEGGAVDGFVRTLRAPAQGSQTIPVFVFHPAGGSTVAYEPLLRRLPADTPMYGLERVEGSIHDRAAQYVPELRARQGDGPFILAGWSLGGVLAVAVAKQLRDAGATVPLVAMLDVALPADTSDDDSPEARVARIRRYQAFAQKTYNIEAELDDEQMAELAAASDDEQMQIMLELIKFSGVDIPGGVIEHQRTSWVEHRELAKAKSFQYDGKAVLYLADRYHDGAIELEPRYADRAPNGGWDKDIADLDVVHIGGDHVQIVDEPYIAKIGADLSTRIAKITADEVL